MRVAKVGRAERDVSSKGGAIPDLHPAFSAQPIAMVPELVERASLTRQSYVDALPIAAAVVEWNDGRLSICTNNDRFAALNEIEPLLGCMPIVSELTAFFRSGDHGRRSNFEWRSGDQVSGRHFHVSIGAVQAFADGLPRCLMTLVDKTAEIQSARSLRAELLHDSLTGLPNRSAFTEAVDEVVAKGDCPHAVLLVDLSRFSRINESLGGVAGDEVIITVARRLISTLRAGDLLARVGGDEFGVLLRLSNGAEDAPAAARRVQQVLSNPFRLARFEVGLDCAIGCALIGESEETSGEEMVRNAQLALKRAKTTGRVEVHQTGEAAISRYRLDLETELRRAIENGDLQLAYQPIVDLAANRITGFEALARWRHPERGPIDPSEFIPVAEEAGLIVPLGRWAVDAALSTLARWDAVAGSPVPLTMSVNVSAIQLARDDVPAMIAKALSTHNISGKRLTIELTESAIVQDPERSSGALQALKALESRIAMDDFGTGYSSLAYLRRLPIDILKIDRSFVSGMLADRDKVAIVRAVLSLADALGKSTTAEGVESIELSQTLAALGCSHGQGYFFAPPLSTDAAFDYWVANSG